MLREIAYYITAAMVAAPPALTGINAAQAIDGGDLRSFIWPYGQTVYECEAINKVKSDYSEFKKIP